MSSIKKGSSSAYSADQIYLLCEFTEMLYSFPPDLSELSHYDSSNSSSFSALYDAAKETKQTVVNYVGNDISTNTTRTILFAYPIYNNIDLIGVLFWENNFDRSFNKYLIPNTIKVGKIPFFTVRYPVGNQSIELLNKQIYKGTSLNDLEYIDKNATYLKFMDEMQNDVQDSDS